MSHEQKAAKQRNPATGCVMTTAPWSRNSRLAASYFRRGEAGEVIFTCPSPWLFGRSREYRLSDAQADELVDRVGRASRRSWILIFLLILISGAILTPVQGLLTAHPIAFQLVCAIFVVLVIAAFMIVLYAAVASVVRNVPWTSVTREPYTRTGNLRKTLGTIIAFESMLPTWALVVLFVGGLISVPLMLSKVYAAREMTLDDLGSICFVLVTTIVFGIPLWERLREKRSAK
jgi:hypothetical protein